MFVPQGDLERGTARRSHHFQQADRYHESHLDFRVRPLVPFGWGAITLAVDADRLEQDGIFRLERFRGVLRSGVIAGMPGADDLPPDRQVTPQDFPATAGRLDVYLALPIDRPNGLNYRM